MVIFLQIFFLLLSSPFFSFGTPIMCMLVYLTYLTSSRFCSFLFFSYFSDWIISINLSSCLLIISSGCSNYLLETYHQIFISIVIISAPEILFVLFLSIKNFVDVLYLVTHCSQSPLVLQTWFPLVFEHSFKS